MLMRADRLPDHERDAAAALAEPARAPLWDRISFAGLMAMLVWAPIPLGSNRPGALGLLAAVLWLLLATQLVGAVLSGRASLAAQLRRLAVPVLLLGAFALLLVAQLAGRSAAPVGELGGLFSTRDAFATQVYLLTTLAHMAALALVVLCVDSPRRAQRLLGTVMAGGLLQAVIAVGLYSGRARYQFMFTEFDQGNRATGTFPNPDHLAGYMELCLAAGFGLMVAQFGGETERIRGWQQRLARSLTFLMSGKMLLRLMLVVMVVALVMTHSRMGNAAFFIALFVTGCVVASRSRKLRTPALWLVVSMAVVDVVVIGQWVGLDRVVERLQGTADSSQLTTAALALPELAAGNQREESIQQRLTVPTLSLQLVRERPWFGHGGGSYYAGFPAIKPVGFPHLWDHAHNDYVEVAADTGLVGLGLLLALAAGSLWRALHLLRDSQPRLNRGLGTATLMALLCMGLHSVVDFNMQIPSNAMTLVVLMALVWAVPTAAPNAADEDADARPGLRSRKHPSRDDASTAVRP
jgi:O-antigen ligase